MYQSTRQEGMSAAWPPTAVSMCIGCAVTFCTKQTGWTWPPLLMHLRLCVQEKMELQEKTQHLRQRSADMLRENNT